MLLQQLKLETSRIFGRKRHIIFFVLFEMMGIFFVYSGIQEYKNFLYQKELFITHEQAKMNLSPSDGHYEAYELRVLYEPTPLSIFFSNSRVFENLYSTIDVMENLEVNRSYKGKNLLQQKGFFKDLAGMFFFLGSLYMVYMGMTSYRNEKYFFKFGNVIIRLGILNSVFVVLICTWYNFPKVFHLRFGASAGEVFFNFVIYLLFFLGFFYGAGLLIRVLGGNKPVSHIYGFIFWFLSVTIIPEAMTIFLQEKSQLLPANEKYNIIKLEEVVNFEGEVQKAIAGIKDPGKRNEISREMVKDFLENGCIKNAGIEKDINHHIQQVIREYEILVLGCPTGFYNYLSGEVSGQGYSGYLGFVNYTLALRRQFIEDYLKKKYNAGDRPIGSLSKAGENIFTAHSLLPRCFPIATALILVYTITFFTVSYVVLKRRTEFIPEIKKTGYEFRKGNTYFVLCKNDRCRDNLFRYYQADENTIDIDRVNAEELNPGVGLAQMFTYFCKFSGVDEKKAREYLQLLEAGDIEAKPPRRRWKREKTPDEVMDKIYCAVMMAGTHKIIVVNDFLKGKSREMEHLFLELVNRLNLAGKIVVYLSSELFLTSPPFEGNIKIDHYKSFRIDPQAVSLR
jgi:hypothetical protein